MYIDLIYIYIYIYIYNYVDVEKEIKNDVYKNIDFTQKSRKMIYIGILIN